MFKCQSSKRKTDRNITTMNIEIIDKMGSDLSVVNAARVSFNKRKNKFEDNIINFLSEFDNTDADQKEQLFKLKLKIFEQDVVKDSGSDDKYKNAKTFIRKADNPMDALLGYMVFTNDAELKEEGVYIPFK